MSRRAWSIVAVVVIVFAAGITVGVTVLGNRSSAAAVTLEPNTSTGTNPFTSSVAISPVAMPANVQGITAATRKTLSTNPKTHTLVATGTAPGLYGGSGNTRVCDAPQLVGFLQQHPDKAAAWAGVLGIATGKIADYVATLTSVLLTNDTLVTNHGYRNGRATTLQSVLQAGTAVMVDATGTPRVKCNCGNPLTPADPTVTTARLRGTGWPGYTPTQVTVVNAGPVTQAFTLVNFTNGQTYTQPVGSGGAPIWAATEIYDTSVVLATTILASTDGRSWKAETDIQDTLWGVSFGAGKWTAVTDSHHAGKNFNITSDGSRVMQSADLKHWTTVATTSGAELHGIAYGSDRWVAVGGAMSPTDYSITGSVIYDSTDGHEWTKVATFSDPYLLTSVAYGNGKWIAAGGARSGGGSTTVTSTDGVHWTPGTRLASVNASIGYGGSGWLSGGPLAGTQGREDGVIQRSASGAIWSTVPSTPFVGLPVNAIGSGGSSGWMVAAHDSPAPSDIHGNGSATFFASTDGARWTRVGHADRHVTSVAFGAVSAGRSTGGTPTNVVAPTTAPPITTTRTTTPPTTAAPAASSLDGVDFLNRDYVDRACGTDAPVHLTNGKYEKQITSFSTCGENVEKVAYVDVTGDGVDDAVVTMYANGGGSATLLWALVFTGSSHGPVQVGQLDGQAFPPYSATQGISAWVGHWGPSDPHCCPSSYDVTTYKYANGTFAAVATRNVPASELPKG
jgi:hypothetical protein